MQPPKNKAWTSPTLYLFSQTSPHSAAVELPGPPLHSHEPGSNPQTLVDATEQPRLLTHVQAGSWSAKIMTMVWKASRAQARLVRTKCLSCHTPNSPQCRWSMSSMHSFWGSPPRVFTARSNGDARSWSSWNEVVWGILGGIIIIIFPFFFFLVAVELERSSYRGEFPWGYASWGGALESPTQTFLFDPRQVVNTCIPILNKLALITFHVSKIINNNFYCRIFFIIQF